MEEEATQPATQIVIDPRRLGQANSGLNEEDLADICCILHPASLPAYKAAALIHRMTPKYTLSTDRSAPIRENYNGAHQDLDTFELAAEGIESYDLALRLSAKLKDPAGGFHFGRNPQRCDFLIGQEDSSRRISNVHFRIYINEFGILMLEDQSTNGTAIDGILLRGKEKENNIEYRHTIDNGTVIILTMTPPEEDYKFIVRIPHRELDADNIAYQSNLTAFFLRNQTAKMDAEARMAAAKVPTKKAPLNLFPTPGATAGTPNASNLSTVTRRVKEWRGGNKYNKICCIGKGAFAVVYKITAKFDGVPYAAKELEKRRFMKNGVLDQKVDMEMKIMRKIQHPNVVRYIEHVDWEDYLYIIMEYIPGGDLGSLIHQQQHLPEFEVKAMAGQLLSALKYLHDNRITHRDVKPDNILIYSREPFHVKLTDFGLSKMIDSEETFLRTFCGTLLYCAPEVYSEYREYDETGKRALRGVERNSLPKQRYGHAVDIWSLAGVLFYALCGSPPYPVQSGTTYQELLNHIMTKPLDIRPLQRARVSDNGIRFVRSMLHTRPEHRATIPDLEASSWLTGVESMEVSMEEEDEIDIVGDGIIEPQIEEGTSQLSIHPNDPEINDSTEVQDSVSDMTEILPLEIPGSFDISDGNVSLEDSSGYMKENVNPGNGRLFGEVNAAALGSSGAITKDQLNLPVPKFRQFDSLDSRSDIANENSRIDDSSRQLRSTTGFMPTITAHSPRTTEPVTNRYLEVDEHAARSSSLMGAESMVGHLNMHSPSSATSPSADSPAPTTELRDPTMSLRRPREEETEDDADWRPADLPAKRRRKSAREIDIPVPPSIFWDPKDKSTHHYNYPRMTTSDFQAYQEYAQSKGEKFVPGQKTFETTMQSFRTSKNSRNSSIEPENSTRAHSEPTREESRHSLMKRDERNLAEVANGPGRSAFNGHAALDRLLPATAHQSNTPPGFGSSSAPTTSHLQPVVGNDFQPPKRILAKFISTSDSCLPTIALNITEAVTSWGRGVDNTSRYQNGMETRIPKYAFKVLLFKPGFTYANPSLNTTQIWQERDQDMRFFISTKASMGIWVNDVHLQSHERQKATTKSKFWCEINHGDLIDVWRSERNPNLFVRFRFECFWGQSKEGRKLNNNVQLVEEGAYLDELEDVCLNQERLILAEVARREEEERAALAREKEQEKLARGFAPRAS